MSKITFTPKDIEVLQKNSNVKCVSQLAITYTDDFKKFFMEEYLSGKFPRQIFEENGFDVEMLGIKRIEQAAAR